MKHIHQIYISDNGNKPGEYILNQMKKLRVMYDDYAYTLYDNAMCREEIKSLFGEPIVRLYDSLNSYSFRADLARYCILYKYAGYYFDVVICPEFKLEFDGPPVMYNAPDGALDNGLNAIDNGVMYFNKPNHPFLRDAISRSLKNIKGRVYGDNPLDITGPAMLGRLSSYDVSFGKSRFIDEHQKGAFYQDELHWLYKPEGTILSSFGSLGTNSYEKMWFDRRVFN